MAISVWESVVNNAAVILGIVLPSFGLFLLFILPDKSKPKDNDVTN